MKVQCACGAKHEFELTPAMSTSPVKFVCPVCGLDASEFVDGLVRQELGQSSTPSGVPVPVVLAGPPPEAPSAPAAAAPSATPLRPRLTARVHTPEAAPLATVAASPPVCSKHPADLAVEKCRVCGKPICPKCMELFGYVCSPLCNAKANSHGIHLPVYEGQKAVIEARQWRRVVRASVAVGTVAVLLLGFWFWYAWFGCNPKPVFSVRFDERVYSGQSVFGTGKESDQIVFLHGATLARYDMKNNHEMWSRSLLDTNEIRVEVDREIQAIQKQIDRANMEASEFTPKMPSREKLTKRMERWTAAAMDLHVRGRNVWVASPGKIIRYDWESGKPDKELKVKEGYGGLISRGDELVMVDTKPGSKPLVTRVNLATCETSTGDLDQQAAADLASNTNGVGFPRDPQLAGLPAGKDGGKPMDPAKVAEQVRHMSLPERLALPATLAAKMNQERTLNELDDGKKKAPDEDPSPPSISLIPTKDGFVEFQVKLAKKNWVERSAMKAPPGKSALDGNVTAGNSVEVTAEMLNERQRELGGDIVREDLSRYRVTLRRPGTGETWTGEVVGPPSLYPLETVNVLASTKQIIVLNKANQKLWQSALAYNVEGGLGSLDAESATYGQGPCVEHKGSLYVFDEGVLSAFDLKTGAARWRLPSVGTQGIFFDDRDMLYVNSTTASIDRVRYSRQIDLSAKETAVVIKVDSRNGKVLWTAEPGGLVNYVSGKYIFTVSAYQPYEPDEEDPYRPETGFESLPFMRLRRINPKNGQEMWEHFQQRAPLDVGFDKNTIRLVFRKEVQVLKFLAF